MKLFEIPVYALARDELDQKVIEKKKKIKASLYYKRKTDENHIEKVLEMSVTPFKTWDYNHIVGYAVVSIIQKDIELSLYSPCPGIHRYRWNSKKKHFLQKAEINGYHFYIGNIRKAEELQRRIVELVNGVASELKEKKGYYVDLEAFNSISPLLDYGKVLGKTPI